MEYENYLFDLYPEFPKGFTLKNRKDPDKCSKELYDDLLQFFCQENLIKLSLKSIENKCQQNFRNENFYTLFVEFINEDEFKLSSDYIGASVYWAKKAGLSDNEIIEYLKISRTIGGHIVFPRGEGQPTVNQARGGESGYYDRFDLTLLAIKKWYSKQKISKNEVAKAIDNYKGWFDLFGSFENFVEFFKLEGFIFKDEKENGETDLIIINLINSNLEHDVINALTKEEDKDICIPLNREDYKIYFNNSNKIIKDRTERLEKKLKNGISQLSLKEKR